METIRIGVLTISDRAYNGEYEDLSGEAIKDYVGAKVKNPIQLFYKLVPDNFTMIKQGFIQLSDKSECSLILSSGGTGPAARDITPEVTEAVCSKLLPGFGELMRSESLKYVKTAILSRQTAGIRGKTLLINLPGKPRAIKQCLDAVFPAIPDCVKLIKGEVIDLVDNSGEVHH